MWSKKTVAVIILDHNKNSPVNVIQDFDSTGYVDEIIVVAGGEKSSLDKTTSRAFFINIKQFSFNEALKVAMNKTSADLIIVTDSDGSYKGKDILKLLSYSDDFDVVFGSRTHLPLVSKGSGMTFYRRLVDDLFGKLISLLYLSSPLTDVGCTLRLTNRKSWQKISSSCNNHTEIFLAEWQLNILKRKIRFIEIPVHFVSVGREGRKTLLYISKRAIVILFYILKIRFF